jgi:hypothetical protein
VPVIFILKNLIKSMEGLLFTDAFYRLNNCVNHLAQFEGRMIIVLLPSKVKKLVTGLCAIF